MLAFLDLASFRSASHIVTIETEHSAYQVNIYCAWLFLRFTSAGRPMGIPKASLSYAFKRSGACNSVSSLNYKPIYEVYP